MICSDCTEKDLVTVHCEFDHAQQGYVCARCERVFNPFMPTNNLHYASKRGAMRRMKRDLAERGDVSVSTRAVAERILRSGFEG
jgi:transposase-like protein